jgi:glycosyltransferase involved in cell wall biosynthesis
MTPNRLVSVCLVTYNHEKYIRAAVHSVLGQTFTDLEVVVVDDGSTDGTAEQLAAIQDTRLIVIRQENRGPAAATNRGLAACRGKYIALCSGDDLCHPDRIRRQLDEYVKGGPRVLFSQCDFIDDEGQPLIGGHFAEGLFDFQNRRLTEILARLFRSGNYFNSITTFTELAILREAPFDAGLLQLQDFDVWARLVRKYDLFIIPEPLVHYRIRSDNGNLSSPRRDRILRVKNEYYLVLRRFFDGVPAELFREAFASDLVNADFADGPEYACEQAFAFGRSQMPLARLIGVERLHALLSDAASAAVLERRYAFDIRRFFALLGGVDVAESFDGYYSTLFADMGSGWSTDQSVTVPICPGDELFHLAFDLASGCRPHALRWDPLELHTCRVRIDGIEVTNAVGRKMSVDPATIETNGRPLPDGSTSFETADPMCWWPVEGDVTRVNIWGRWETDDALKTILAQSRHTHELKLALAESQRQLRSVLDSPYWRVTAPLRAVRAATRRRRVG